MAMYDLTKSVERIVAMGGTADQLLALPDVAMVGGEVTALNRAAQVAAYTLEDEIEAASKAPAPVAAQTEPMATERQVAYVIRLIGQRQRADVHGGFVSFSGGYPDAAALARMSRRSISTLIDQLRDSD